MQKSKLPEKQKRGEIKTHNVVVEDIECELKASDETDQKFLNAAVEAASSYGLVYLVTGNTKHFPNKSFTITPAQFMNIYLTDDR